MIQEISPKFLNNQFDGNVKPQPEDTVCVFHGKDILCRRNGNSVILPTYGEFEHLIEHTVYLFDISGASWFMSDLKDGAQTPENYGFENVREHRYLGPRDTVYGEMTAKHLNTWYTDNRFCGRCGCPTVHDTRLRMLSCPACGNQIFPKICPAIIAGVIDGDRILLTRYAGRSYKNYALIAGFTEIGETAEETVVREVYEESGIRVKNIRYWKTQPWGIDSDLLLGFFCELDGSDRITVDKSELSSAEWVKRSDLDFEPDDVSLTHAMIRLFMEDRVPGMPV